MEVLDLYKDEFEKTGGTMIRGEGIPQGHNAMIIFVCVFNSEGKLLIQQRQKTKKTWPGKWDVSAGGVVQSGETSRQAAKRELEEETGICLEESELQKIITIYYDREMHDIFAAQKDLSEEDLTLQEEEVMDAKWVTREEVSAMIHSGEFIPVYEEFIDLMFRMKTKPGIMTFE